MMPLNDAQKQLLFDYSLGQTSELEAAQAQELVFSNDQAARLVASIKASLSPLESITPEPCPDELAEGTVWRVKQALRTSRLQLTQLIAAEQSHKTGLKAGFWRDIFGRLATAAVFIVVGSALIAGWRVVSNYTHQNYWQQRCGAQLAGLFGALSNYRADNDGQMPTLAAEPGAPWWKIGDQGPENVSNTRRMWILVKNDYARPTDFVCPVQKPTSAFGINPQEYNDFPSRKLVTYSFRISCPKSPSAGLGRQVIVADMNPVFEDLPVSSEGTLIINLSDALLRRNSPNHNGRGQNVLFCDGSVVFLRTRQIDVSLDDIFTLQDTRTYRGVELPVSEADAFLAP